MLAAPGLFWAAGFAGALDFAFLSDGGGSASGLGRVVLPQLGQTERPGSIRVLQALHCIVVLGPALRARLELQWSRLRDASSESPFQLSGCGSGLHLRLAFGPSGAGVPPGSRATPMGARCHCQNSVGLELERKAPLSTSRSDVGRGDEARPEQFPRLRAKT